METMASGSTANNISSWTHPPDKTPPPMYSLAKSTQNDASLSNNDPSSIISISHNFWNFLDNSCSSNHP